MARRLVYRDYRPGSAGQFTTKETFERLHTTSVVHREYVGVPDNVIDSVDELFDYDDYDDEDLTEEEYHATGDTGRSKK